MVRIKRKPQRSTRIGDTGFGNCGSERSFARVVSAGIRGVGAFFIFCDAGVRFVWDDADPAIMNALSTRDGNPHSGVERIIHESLF